ncbi:MAG: protein O-GlcNAc transferase [Phycisphaerales bacterium]|nr:protein O-GlcNAc transferase [Phycisphaerales bacterium]
MERVTRMTIQQAIELAIGHERAGRLAEAEGIYREVLAQRPEEPTALHLLGCLAMRGGNLAAAEQLIRRATQVGPEVAQRHSDLGVVLQSQGRIDEAAAAFRAALQVDPNLADALSNLSTCQCERGDLADAVALAQRAIELSPSHADAFNNLGNVLTMSGRGPEAIAAYRRAIELQSDAASAAAAQNHSNLLLALHYQPDVEPAAMLEEHRAFARKFAAPAGAVRHPNGRDRKRRLRIGYVSSDFRQHSVGYFIEAAIEKHDREQFEVICYSDVTTPDAMTRRMQPRVKAWRAIAGVPHGVVEKVIRQDQIDILVDLASHSGHNRLPVFARKPAPVQVSYLGYPDTTGLSAMDYRITDSRVDPPGEADSFSVEKLHRLDPCAWCFRPHEPYPPLPAPAEAGRPVTFGTFNAVAKLNEPLIATWAEIVRETPDSRFFMKAGAFVDNQIAARVRGLFEAHGVAAERVEFVGQKLDATQHLAMYAKIDIALDTFPYNGTTTTCEAMWMGVPVVTLAGRAHAGRVGVSLLASVRLEELIAADREAYVRIAVDLARDRDRLRQLQQSMRQRMLASPLMNGYDFARRLESAYRAMWGHWCQSPGRAAM